MIVSQLPMLALPFPMIDPIILQVGPLAVRWYGVAYVTGILLGWWYSRRLVSNNSIWGGKPAPFGKIDLDDFLVWAALGIVLGGRVGYILFYDLARYLNNPAEIFAVWRGGMSFHGGALGTLVAMIMFSRSRGFSTLSLMDVIATVSTFGLFFGRIANFINAELWGRVTDVSWGVVFPNGGELPRHPSQLYEAMLEGLVLFLILRMLIFAGGKFAKPGFIAGAWIFLYGVSRIVVEFFRQPDAHIGYLSGGWLTMGMVLSIPMLMVGAFVMMRANPVAEQAK